MKVLLIVAFCFFVFSCKDKKTCYKYQGVSVTRIDDDGESTFFYGEIKDDTTGYPFIKAEYYGVNNGLDVFIHFKKDSTVELIHLGGEYLIPSSSAERKLFIGEYTNDKLDIRELSRQPNIVRASDALKLEEQWYVEKISHRL